MQGTDSVDESQKDNLWQESVFNFGFSDFRLEKTLVNANVFFIHDGDASDQPQYDVFSIIIPRIIRVALLYKILNI